MNYITEVYKEKDVHVKPSNGAPDYWYIKYGKLKGYETCGGRWCRQFHKTLKGAEKDKAIMDSIDAKFPELNKPMNDAPKPFVFRPKFKKEV